MSSSLLATRSSRSCTTLEGYAVRGGASETFAPFPLCAGTARIYLLLEIQGLRFPDLVSSCCLEGVRQRRNRHEIRGADFDLVSVVVELDSDATVHVTPDASPRCEHRGRAMKWLEARLQKHMRTHSTVPVWPL